MSGGIGKRLAKLETVWRRPPGCEVCRFWGPSAHVFLDKPLRPERCPGCGRTVPIKWVREYRIVHDLL